MKINSSVVGYVFSVFYVTTFLLIRDVSFSDSLYQLRRLDLNELGDFFAGLFGPLAVFWLILSFRVQQKELKKSSDALDLQVQEMSKSVEQQKELVNITRAEIAHKESEYKRLMRPLLTFKSKGYQSSRGDGTLTAAKFELIVQRNSFQNLTISTNDELVKEVPILEQDGSIVFEVKPSEIISLDSDFKIIYQSPEGYSYEETRFFKSGALVLKNN